MAMYFCREQSHSDSSVPRIFQSLGKEVLSCVTERKARWEA